MSGFGAKLGASLELTRRLEQAYGELLRSYGELVELLGESGLLELVELYEEYSGCSVEETWVLNKVKKKYYYYYLKCADGRSIYLGKSPGSINVLKQVGKRALELKNAVDEAGRAISELGDHLKQYILDLHLIATIMSTEHYESTLKREQ